MIFQGSLHCHCSLVSSYTSWILVTVTVVSGTISKCRSVTNDWRFSVIIHTSLRSSSTVECKGYARYAKSGLGTCCPVRTRWYAGSSLLSSLMTMQTQILSTQCRLFHLFWGHHQRLTWGWSISFYECMYSHLHTEEILRSAQKMLILTENWNGIFLFPCTCTIYTVLLSRTWSQLTSESLFISSSLGFHR